MMDFGCGLVLGIILAKSGADLLLWKWIRETWASFKAGK
jgi:hypothetical protein